MANSKITIKLLIDARSQKVLIGEAGKDFVDFMFTLLALPLSSVVKLLSPSAMIGSIGKVYQSVENLNEAYLVANRDKSSLLQPKVSIFDAASPLLLDTKGATAELKYFLCIYCNRKVTTNRNIMCPSCKQAMYTEVTFVVPSMPASSSSTSSSSSAVAGHGGESVGGVVQGLVTYMISDDLEVKPMSAISSVSLINSFSAKKDIQFEEKVVTVTMKEGLALLKSSLTSSTVLTDVFCSSAKRAKPASSTKK